MTHGITTSSKDMNMFIKTRTTLMVLVLSAISVGYTLAQGSPEARAPENDVTHGSVTLESNTALPLTLPAARLESETTILYVDNRHLSDQHVYAVTMTGRRISLGIVHAVSTREFEIPPALLEDGAEFQIKVYPLGSQGRFNYIRPVGSGIKTPPIAVTPGDRIELFLSSDINESTVAVVQS